MTEWSLRKRLTRRLALLIAGFWLATSAIAAVVVFEEMTEVLDSSLEETAHRIAPLANSLKSLKKTDAEDASRDDNDVYDHEEYVSYQIRNAAGKLVFRSHDAPTIPWALSNKDGFSTDGSWRIYTVHLKDKSLAIQVGENLDHRFVAISEATLAMIAPILILLPLLLTIFHHMLNRAFVPVIAFSREIQERGSDNLSDVSASGLPNEFDTIRNRLNDLLRRLRMALDAERAFSANSAHQLRTPVAAALAQSEMLERELKNDSERDRVRKLSDALRRLGRIVEKLLQLARADLGTHHASEMVDPAEYLHMILTDFRKLFPSQQFHVSGSEFAKPIRIDPDSFGIILQNVIENAVAYSTPNMPIDIRFNSSGRLTVTNDCAVVSPDLLEQLGERFVRGSHDTRGSGLGLAIIKSLARKLDIELAIRSPMTGQTRGFEVELNFPKGTV